MFNAILIQYYSRWWETWPRKKCTWRHLPHQKLCTCSTFSCNRESFIKHHSKKKVSMTLYKWVNFLIIYIFPIKITIGGNYQYPQMPQNFPAFLMDTVYIISFALFRPNMPFVHSSGYSKAHGTILLCGSAVSSWLCLCCVYCTSAKKVGVAIYRPTRNIYNVLHNQCMVFLVSLIYVL